MKGWIFADLDDIIDCYSEEPKEQACPYEFSRRTNHMIVAILHLLTLSIKYPIVTLEVRKGHVDCKDCDANWCDKSQKFGKK